MAGSTIRSNATIPKPKPQALSFSLKNSIEPHAKNKPKKEKDASMEYYNILASLSEYLSQYVLYTEEGKLNTEKSITNSKKGKVATCSPYVALICGLVTLFTVIICSVFGKKMVKMIPFIMGILANREFEGECKLIAKINGEVTELEITDNFNHSLVLPINILDILNN